MTVTTLAPPNEPRVNSLALMIVERLAGCADGTLVTYAEFHSIIGENPLTQRGRQALNQAKTRLLKSHDKLLVNVRSVGYRVILPNEHVGESMRLEKHARHKQRRALDAVVHTDEMKLTPQERQTSREQELRIRLKLATDKTIGRATLTANGDAVLIPAGKQLAKLLQEKMAG